MTTTPTAPDAPQAPERRTDWHQVFRGIVSGSALTGFLAVVLALVAGSILIAITNGIGSVPSAYQALFRGAIWNDRVSDPLRSIKPLTESLKYSAPLILSGLGVGLGFRAGLFNIGGRGQMLLAGAAAGWVGFKLSLPAPLHILLALVAAIVAGAIWGGLAGFLKARTGAHEVIVTIMLNYVGFYLVFWALTHPSLLQAPGSNNPKSPAMRDSVILPHLLGPRFNLHLGFVIALLAVAFVWWLLGRSAMGLRFRAVGENPAAAKVAGINVGLQYTLVMAISGALVGLAGANQVIGTETSGITNGLDAGIGFDAITVALLGRSRPLGILAAGLLFGALKAGGYAMQASQGVPVDIVLVVQSLIVLFIAAPSLVRAIFRLPAKEAA